MSKIARYTEELPLDLEFEVLSRLPVDSILKFKCVCKFWHILFGSPSFIDLHLSRAANDNCFLVTRDTTTAKTSTALSVHEYEINVSLLSSETLEVVSDVRLPLESTMGVTGSCNGVICLFSKSGIFTLFNPATKQSKTLPPPPNASYIPKSAFHCNHFFGFDAKSNDYKIMVLATINYCNSSREFVHEIQIFSLRCGSWKEISVSLPAGLPFRIWLNGHINGIYHFVGYTRDRKEVILTFDIGDELFGRMKHPIEGSSSSVASVLNGSLAIIDERSCEFGLRSIDVWVMKEYGVDESWNKMYTTGDIEAAEPLYFCSCDMLLETKPIEDQEFEGELGGLISYDLRTREIKQHQIRGARHTMRCFCYFPSLVNFM